MAEKNTKMDPAQLEKMTEVLGADLRNIKEELKREREEKERIVREQQAKEAEYKKMQEQMNGVIAEKKEYYSNVINNNVKPFLEDLKKQSENDSRLSSSMSIFERDLNKGLEDAFMDPSQLATLQVAVAASAANQVTSSKLEKLFQTQKQWEEKYTALQEEKEKLLKEQNESKKEWDSANGVKDKMVEELKKELSEIKAKYEKSINNADGHFSKNSENTKMEDVEMTAETVDAPPAPVENAQTIAATASASYHGGFGTLFDFTPRTNWRSNAQN